MKHDHCGTTLLEQYRRNLERLRAERDRDPSADQRVWLEQMSELASLVCAEVSVRILQVESGGNGTQLQSK